MRLRGIAQGAYVALPWRSRWRLPARTLLLAWDWLRRWLR